MDKSLIPTTDNSYDALVVHECGSKTYHIFTKPQRRQRWLEVERTSLHINIYWAVTTHKDNTVIDSSINRYVELGD